MFNYFTQDVLFDIDRPQGIMLEGLCE